MIDRPYHGSNFVSQQFFVACYGNHKVKWMLLMQFMST